MAAGPSLGRGSGVFWDDGIRVYDKYVGMEKSFNFLRYYLMDGLGSGR